MHGDPNERGYGTGAATGVDYGGHDTDDVDEPTTASQSVSVSARTPTTNGMPGVVVTGVEELDAIIKSITAEEGAKSINSEMRKAIKAAVVEIVLPKVIELIPYDDGRGSYKDDGQHLEDQLVVKAIRRSRTRMGYEVGFPFPLFTGDTFYGGFLEFGWDHRGGFHVEADSYLRRALYPQANEILGLVTERLAAFVAQLDRTV